VANDWARLGAAPRRVRLAGRRGGAAYAGRSRCGEAPRPGRHRGRLRPRRPLAGFLSRRGRFQEAEPLHARGLAILEKRLDMPTPALAAARSGRSPSTASAATREAEKSAPRRWTSRALAEHGGCPRCARRLTTSCNRSRSSDQANSGSKQLRFSRAPAPIDASGGTCMRRLAIVALTSIGILL
jgi:hypothetical protein